MIAVPILSHEVLFDPYAAVARSTNTLLWWEAYQSSVSDIRAQGAQGSSECLRGALSAIKNSFPQRF
jgi:hypothetical protein